MWPHSFTIALGDVAVGVGTDDDQLAALLAPHSIPPHELPDPLRTDFGAELHPEPPTERRAPRRLPTIQHGTSVFGRSADVALLRDGLLRTLAGFVAPVPAGHVCLTGLPLLRDGEIELAAPESISGLAHRALVARGFSPVYVPTVVVDPLTRNATIAAPWGSGDAPVVAPLRRWWAQLPAIDTDRSLSLAHLVAHVAHRIAPSPFAVDAPVAGRDPSLAALVALVEQLPPVVGGPLQ